MTYPPLTHRVPVGVPHYGYRPGYIYRADCLRMLEGLPAKSVQLLIVDPPYFEVKGDFDFIWPSFEAYLQDVERWAKACKRVLADNGTLYWWGMDKKIAYTQVILDKYFMLLNTNVWEKPGLLNEWESRRNYPERGHERVLVYAFDFEPSRELFTPLIEFFNAELRKGNISRADIDGACGTANVSQYWLQEREFTIPTEDRYQTLQKLGNGTAFAKPYQWVLDQYNPLKKRYESQRRAWNNHKKLTDVLKFPQEVNKWEHLTKKPPALYKAIIETSSRPGDLCCFPFVGSGTGPAMCAKLGRRFIGSEIHPKHHRTSVDRLSQAKAGILPRTPEEVKRGGGQLAIFD